MFKNAARAARAGARRRPALLLALGLLACAAPAAAAATPRPATADSGHATGVEITPAVRLALQQIEEQWLQWVSAYNEQRSTAVVEDLLTTARQLGMARLPDLSFGALTRAGEAAGRRDFPRAHQALKAAEKLDPGRPETAFAEARVARLEGSYGTLAAALGRGYFRLALEPAERFLWLQNLLVWGYCLLLLTGGFFVALQMATKGAGLFRDLAALFGRRLPRPLAIVLALAFLLWPLALPGGPLWLAIFWSMLLFLYSGPSERGVFVVLWLLVAGAPLLIAEERRSVDIALSPPMQAMTSLEQHRLYGGLFTDLGVLRALLPDSPAVKQLLADFHRTLGQWEQARSLYRQVLDEEPENTTALLNLGAYSFYKGDFPSAIQLFQKVTTTDLRGAAAKFNLSQAYSESYSFDDSRQAQAQAREIDNQQVDRWIANGKQHWVVTPNGGIERIPEIRRKLLSLGHEEAAASLVRRFRLGQAALFLGLLLGTLTLYLARRSAGSPEIGLYYWRLGHRTLDLWRGVLVPGLSSAESGEGVKAFLALLFPAAILMIPLFGRFGYPIAWGYDPGSTVSSTLAIGGLVVYLGLRFRTELRNAV
jgi:tetratricopeptide (TPR) repeat protein